MLKVTLKPIIKTAVGQQLAVPSWPLNFSPDPHAPKHPERRSKEDFRGFLHRKETIGLCFEQDNSTEVEMADQRKEANLDHSFFLLIRLETVNDLNLVDHRLIGMEQRCNMM